MLHRVNGWYEGPSERRAARKPRTDRGKIRHAEVSDVILRANVEPVVVQTSCHAALPLCLGPYQANFPRHPSQKDTEDGRDGLGDDNGRVETAQESQLDGFVALSARLRAGNEQGFVISACSHARITAAVAT